MSRDEWGKNTYTYQTSKVTPLKFNKGQTNLIPHFIMGVIILQAKMEVKPC